VEQALEFSTMMRFFSSQLRAVTDQVDT
jgi:hypothetical protein